MCNRASLSLSYQPSWNDVDREIQRREHNDDDVDDFGNARIFPPESTELNDT